MQHSGKNRNQIRFQKSQSVVEAQKEQEEKKKREKRICHTNSDQTERRERMDIFINQIFLSLT